MIYLCFQFYFAVPLVFSKPTTSRGLPEASRSAGGALTQGSKFSYYYWGDGSIVAVLNVNWSLNRLRPAQ